MFRFSILLLTAVLISGSLWGQAFYDTTVVVSPLNPNKVDFRIEARAPQKMARGEDDPEPPQPRYVAYTNLGDGTFRRDSLLVDKTDLANGNHSIEFSHIYPKMTTVTQYSPEVSMVAIYSPTKPPVLKMNRINIPGPGNPGSTLLTPDIWNPFKDSSGSAAIIIDPQWPRCRPLDTVFVAVSFRMPEEIVLTDASRGTLIIDVDADHFKIDRVIRTPKSLQITDVDQRDHQVTIDYSGLPSDSINTFFLVLIAKEVTLTETVKSIYSYITAELTLDEEVKFTVKQGGEVITTEAFQQRLKYGKSQVFATSSETIAGTQTIVELVAAIDPNRIFVKPDCFVSGKGEFKAGVTVTFFNTGLAPADTVIVESSTSPASINAGRGPVTYRPSEGIDLGSGGSGHNFLDTLSGKTESVLLTVEQVIEARNDSESKTDLTLHPAVSGHIKYDVTVKGYLRPGTRIPFDATIFMDNSAFQCSTFVVDVNRYCGPKVRWQHGIKLIAFLKGDEISEQSYGGRYVIRAPLNSPEGRYLPNNYIKALPSWWIQWEGGVSKLRFKPFDVSIQATYIDLVPLQVLFVPRWKNSDKRPLGFLAGYTLSTRISDPATARNTNFINRLEHSIDGSVEFGNVLGRPGIALGATISYRITAQSNLYSGYANYFYPSVFIRHNLAHRLRYRFQR